MGLGQFSCHARFIGARPKLRVHQGANASLQNLPAIHRGPRRLGSLPRRDHGEKSVGGGHRDFVTRPVERCLRLVPRSHCGGDIGAAQTEVVGLPGYQDAGAAVPYRAEVVGFHAVHAGYDALRQQQSVKGIARGAIRLQQAVHAGQIGGLRQPDARRRGVYLFLRYANRGIISERVFHRLRDGHLRRWRCLLSGEMDDSGEHDAEDFRCSGAFQHGGYFPSNNSSMNSRTWILAAARALRPRGVAR